MIHQFYQTLNPELKKSFLLWMSIALILQLAASFFSLGHYAADEHFQILEFINFKLGGIPVKEMPFEYHFQVRPWFQPFLYWGLLLKPLEWLGINNPFHLAFTFRLFTGLLGFIGLVLLSLCVPKLTPNPLFQRISFLFIATLWFLPALHARASSESLSATFFWMGTCLYFLALPGTSSFAYSFGIGVLWGLSFECRFQVGLMILGAILWILILQNQKKQLLGIFTGFSILLVFGRWIDRWGYGQWVFTPWNYFHYNLIENRVSSYGTAPWWDIFRFTATETWPVLGSLVLLLFLFTWAQNPKHLFTWCCVPFFIVHLLIGHKELRFFFPLAAATPLFFTLGLSKLKKINDLGSSTKKIVLILLAILFLNNLLGLLAYTFLPAARNISFQKKIWDRHLQSPLPMPLYYWERDPYELWDSIIRFYRPASFVTQKIQLPEQISLLKDIPLGQSRWLVLPRTLIPKELGLERAHCFIREHSHPQWVTSINFNDWLNRSPGWSLLECLPKN